MGSKSRAATLVVGQCGISGVDICIQMVDVFVKTHKVAGRMDKTARIYSSDPFLWCPRTALASHTRRKCCTFLTHTLVRTLQARAPIRSKWSWQWPCRPGAETKDGRRPCKGQARRTQKQMRPSVGRATSWAKARRLLPSAVARVGGRGGCARPTR